MELEGEKVGPPDNESLLRDESLALLKKLLRGEDSLDCPKDEEFLLKFLRARKYDAEAAFRTLQKYFRARRDYPAVFDNFSPSAVPYDAIFREHKLLAVSSRRDPLGRAVMLVRTGSWDPSICTVDEFTKACFILVEWMLLDEDVQKCGVVFVIDHKGLGLHHMTHFTPFTIQRLVSLTQDCYPVGVKAVYITNSPSIFDLLFSIAKTFLRSKLVERVHLFGSDLDRLQDVVPLDVIPEEGGGTFETFDYDKLEADLLGQCEYFEEVNRYGYGKESTYC
ncbi:alpha-tocopherol transfer protein-like isoform X1 [Amblyomma americanum]